MYFKLSKTVLSLNSSSSKRKLSLASLQVSEADDENKENVPPAASSASPTPSANSLLAQRPQQQQQHQFFSGRRSLTTPLRSAQLQTGSSPPSVLKKAMRSVSKSALEKAYAAIRIGQESGEGRALNPISASPPGIEIFDVKEEQEEGAGEGKVTPSIPTEAPKIEIPGLDSVDDLGDFAFGELQSFEIEAVLAKSQEEEQATHTAMESPLTTPKPRNIPAAVTMERIEEGKLKETAEGPKSKEIANEGKRKENLLQKGSAALVPPPPKQPPIAAIPLQKTPRGRKQKAPSDLVTPSTPCTPMVSSTLSRSKTLPPNLAAAAKAHQQAMETPTPLPKLESAKEGKTLKRASTVHFPAPASRPTHATSKNQDPVTPGALKAALDAVSEASVKSAYAAFRRGDSLDDSQLRPQGKKINNSMNRVATIAARRAFTKREPLVRRHKTSATRKREKEKFTANVLGNATSNNNSAVWWSHPSSFASTPAPSILDFSPDRSAMGHRQRIKRFLKKVVERLMKHKEDRKKLERRPSSRRASQATIGTTKATGGKEKGGQGFIGDRGRSAMRDMEELAGLF